MRYRVVLFTLLLSYVIHLCIGLQHCFRLIRWSCARSRGRLIPDKLISCNYPLQSIVTQFSLRDQSAIPYQLIPSHSTYARPTMLKRKRDVSSTSSPVPASVRSEAGPSSAVTPDSAPSKSDRKGKGKEVESRDQGEAPKVSYTTAEGSQSWTKRLGKLVISRFTIDVADDQSSNATWQRA